MSTNNSNHLVNPAAREAMDKFKMEAAADFWSPIHLKKAPYIP
ncbi:MAG: alpha/beta-type small acid-soluble spore protein [Oscillospiraceae bacterium]|nr:alpha/beta-type small acid-soluble spore protein [Oscillospiraceae bacterium]